MSDEEISKQHHRLWSMFADHVRNHVRNDDNPKIAVCDNFDPNSYKFLIVNLKNVSKGNLELYQNVEKFHGAKLETEESVDDRPTVFKVFIPLDIDTRNKKKKHRSKKKMSKHRQSAPPSPIEGMVYIMISMGIGLVAAWTTTAEDWSFLLF